MKAEERRGDDTRSFEAIDFAVSDRHVATITLNRPERLNAFSQQMAEEIARAWQLVRDTPSIHAVVLRAIGDRAFCTGIDVKLGAWWMDRDIWNQDDPGVVLGPKHHKVWKPVVCAVNGMCAGGGHYLINEADIILCSSDATFFDPHASVGIVSALEPIGLLYRGVPLGDVLRWALMGNEERLGASTALRLGLVTEVVEPDKLWSRADELASAIALRSPRAVQGTVRAIWESLEMHRSIALQNGMSYTHLGNPAPGEARHRYSLDRDIPEIR